MIQEKVEKLKLLGPMPDESSNDISGKLVDEYADLINSVKKPISLEEAKILIKLFPPVALFGVEWSLLHLIESIYKDISYSEYQELLNECNSEENKFLLLERVKKTK